MFGGTTMMNYTLPAWKIKQLKKFQKTLKQKHEAVTQCIDRSPLSYAALLTLLSQFQHIIHSIESGRFAGQKFGGGKSP